MKLESRIGSSILLTLMLTIISGLILVGTPEVFADSGK